jgi:nitrite reductase/ring-hydroxylating ferredoxin subunit
MATAANRPICAGSELVESGAGARFYVRLKGQQFCAFAVRYQGVVRAYLNVCAHRSVELDWEQGKFFDVQQRWLICSTHGALYDPASGQCVDGPCQGAALTSLPVDERDGIVHLITNDDLQLA